MHTHAHTHTLTHTYTHTSRHKHTTQTRTIHTHIQHTRSRANARPCTGSQAEVHAFRYRRPLGVVGSSRVPYVVSTPGQQRLTHPGQRRVLVRAGPGADDDDTNPDWDKEMTIFNKRECSWLFWSYDA